MSKHIISNFPSLVGKHCSSTAIREITMYYKNPLSEAMIFGIGSGLFFSYFSFANNYPRLLITRTPYFENNFFNAINHSFKWYSNEVLDVDKIINFLENDIPILMISETGYLDFYGTAGGRNVAGHTFTIVGFDITKKTFVVSDFISSEYFSLNLADLKKTAGQAKVPYDRKNVWAPVHPFIIEDIREAILKGMRKNAKDMLQDKNDNYGILNIKKLAAEVPYWTQLPEWKECCIHTYMMIEKIGSGGSGFRKLYTDFLIEASSYIQEIKQYSCINKMEEIHKLYKLLGRKFFSAGRNRDGKILTEIQKCLENIYLLEKEFWETISYVVNKYSVVTLT
ncbi:hypothetical protein IIO_06381 [Bacillus cereus VD115]|nr:hypothetical protein IIO_06381 [Bacillus cereus VD115]